jgi:hypothetical protein
VKIRYVNGGTTVVVEFDATLREVHTSGATATTHPVEKGSDVADHVQVNQPRLQVEAIVSNTPLETPKSHMDGVSGSVRGLNLNVQDSKFITFGVTTTRVPVARQVGAQVLQFSGSFDRVKKVHAALVDIVEGKRLVEITNGLRDYQDMIIGNLTAPREAKDGTSCTFTFDAVHIDFVETAEGEAVASTTTKRKNRGNKGTQEAKPETKEYESFAHKLKEPAIKLLQNIGSSLGL